MCTVQIIGSPNRSCCQGGWQPSCAPGFPQLAADPLLPGQAYARTHHLPKFDQKRPFSSPIAPLSKSPPAPGRAGRGIIRAWSREAAKDKGSLPLLLWAAPWALPPQVAKQAPDFWWCRCGCSRVGWRIPAASPIVSARLPSGLPRHGGVPGRQRRLSSAGSGRPIATGRSFLCEGEILQFFSLETSKSAPRRAY